jgi:hypothetical protein
MPRVITAPYFLGLSGHEWKASPGRYSFKRGQTWLHRNTPPTWRNTSPQQRVNQANKAATQAFSSITDQQRLSWSVWAPSLQKQHLWLTRDYSDREAFIRTNLLRDLNDDPIINSAPLIPAKTCSISLDSLIFLRQQPGLLITFTHDHPVFDTHYFLVRVSKSFPSAQRKAQPRDYRYAGDVSQFSFVPVQQSPQTVFFPYTPLQHDDLKYLWTKIIPLSPDYAPGPERYSHLQLSSLDFVYYYDSGTYITYNPSTLELYFFINSNHVATLYQNGNLYLLGETIQYDPSDSTLARDSIYFSSPELQLRFAVKTRSSPAWHTCFSLDDSGNLLVYGEVYEASAPTSEPEDFLFHPYRNPSYLQFSTDKTTASLRFNLEPTPQNALLLKEVYENAL